VICNIGDEIFKLILDLPMSMIQVGWSKSFASTVKLVLV